MTLLVTLISTKEKNLGIPIKFLSSIILGTTTIKTFPGDKLKSVSTLDKHLTLFTCGKFSKMIFS